MGTADLSAVMPALKVGIGDVNFAILQHFIELVPVSKGDTVIGGGAAMDFAFVVVSGNLSMSLHDKVHGLYELNVAGAGRWVGQMCFLEPGDNPLTIQAVENSVIGKLTRSSFDKMADAYPAAADALLETLSVELSNRMRRAGKLLFKRFAWDQVDGIEGEDAAKQWFTKVYCEMNGLFG